MILIASAPPVNAALSDIDLTSILPETIANGGSRFMEMVGDQLYGMAGVTNATESQKYIVDSFTKESKYLESEGFQSTKDMNSFYFLVGLVCYIFVGLAIIAHQKSGITSGFEAKRGYESTYIGYIIGGFVFYSFYLYGLQWLIDVRWIVQTGFIVQSANIVPMTPQNGITYLFIAIVSVIVWAFLVLADIIVVMVGMYLLWLLCASKLPIIGLIAWVILVYAGILFALPVFLSFIFMAGATAIESLHIGGLVLPYIIVMAIIILICYIVVILPLYMLYAKLIRGTK